MDISKFLGLLVKKTKRNKLKQPAEMIMGSILKLFKKLIVTWQNPERSDGSLIEVSIKIK